MGRGPLRELHLENHLSQLTRERKSPEQEPKLEIWERSAEDSVLERCPEGISF
jgi:hypothetical protein